MTNDGDDGLRTAVAMTRCVLLGDWEGQRALLDGWDGDLAELVSDCVIMGASLVRMTGVDCDTTLRAALRHIAVNEGES